MTQFVSETFNVSGMFVTIQTAMSLSLSGRTTGIATDTCDAVFNSAPINAVGQALSSNLGLLWIGVVSFQICPQPNLVGPAFVLLLHPLLF